MGGCVFSLHGKIILLTMWKINDTSLSLLGSGESAGVILRSPHGGAQTQLHTPLWHP